MKLTLELLMKFVPFTVSVKAAEPAATLVGCKDVREGTGFTGPLTVKVRAFDVPPPGAGFVTVTDGVPAETSIAAGIVAVSCVALT